MHRSSSTDTVRVRLGQMLAEKVGRPFVDVVLPEPSLDVEAFRRAVAGQYPVLEPWLSSVLVVGNGRVLGASERIRQGQEIALLPPQAGG